MVLALGIRQVVRHQVLVLAFGGSNPSSPAKLVLTILTKPLPCRVEVFGLGHIEQPNYCALGSNNVIYEYAFI